jgi:hypothetical protein
MYGSKSMFVHPGPPVKVVVNAAGNSMIEFFFGRGVEWQQHYTLSAQLVPGRRPAYVKMLKKLGECSIASPRRVSANLDCRKE